MDWYIWRLLFSDRIKVTMGDLELYWSFEDLTVAHELLDAFDAASQAP